MSERLDRRLFAVMFTDMVGYTALMQVDERLALDKRDRYVSAFESHHDAFGGTVVQRLGDGSMSMFPSSLAAVHAAVAIQQELAVVSVARLAYVYSDDTPGREFVDQARAALSADEVDRATEVGRNLTITEAVDLARIPETASV